KRKYRINEAMRIADTNKAFAAEAADLIRVVWNNVYLLNQVQLRYAIPNLGVNVVELVAVKLFRRLFFGQKVCPRRDHSYADNVFVNWNEPSPMKLFRVEDQRIVFRILPGSVGAANGAG